MDALEDALREAAPGALVILEAYASDCPKCRRMRPRYEAFARDRPDTRCLAVNLSKVVGAYAALDVAAVPCFFAFADGERVDDGDVADLEALESYAADWADACAEEECVPNDSWV